MLRYYRMPTLEETIAYLLKSVFIYVILAPFIIYAVFPFVWMAMTSVRARQELYTSIDDPFHYRLEPTWEHFELLFDKTRSKFPIFVENSLIIGVIVVVITLVAAIPASYSLARLTGRWGERMGIGMFLVYLVPTTLLFIPMSRVVAFLGLYNSKWALVVVYPTFTIPFCTWLLIGFMKAIPKDIEEQALVDGYSRLGALMRVVVPLALPGIITVVVFTFMLTLHEYIYSLAFAQSSAEKPISLGVTTELILGDVLFWQPLMAAAILVAIPVAIVYNFFLNRFVSGLTLGAVKG